MTEYEIERLVDLPGVYAIVNTVTGKRYVGSTINTIRHRWRTHRNKLKANSHGNKYLQSAWNKYGSTKFEFILLEQCPPEDCLKLEQKWMDYYKVADRRYGYNGRPIAESNLGKKFGPMAEAHKKKIIAKLIGRPVSEITRLKLSRILTGKRHTLKARYKMKVADRPKGWSHTKEACDKISRTRRKLIREGILKIISRPCTEETKRKISDSKLGKRMNEISIRKMANSKRGVPWSPARRDAQFLNMK